MRRSGVILAASGFLLASIMLSGCQSGTPGAEPGISSTKPAEPVKAAELSKPAKAAELKIDGTCEIVIGGTRKSVSWYLWQADYNSLQDNAVWARFQCPKGTVSAYSGILGRIQWCEFHGGVIDMLVAEGVSFDTRVHPKPQTDNPEVSIRKWLLGEKQDGMSRHLSKGAPYVFCFDYMPVTDGRSKGAAVDFGDALGHLLAIVEVVPTYDCGQSASAGLAHLRPENLVKYEEKHFWYRWSVAPRPDGTMQVECESGKPAAAPPGLVKRLLYALNTMKMHPTDTAHTFTEKPVSQSSVAWTQDGKMRRATIEYDNGAWYLTNDMGNHFAGARPELLYGVEEEARVVAGASKK
jgi:hypothetical protein